MDGMDEMGGEWVENGWRMGGDWMETGWRLDGDWMETGWRLDGEWMEIGWRMGGDWVGVRVMFECGQLYCLKKDLFCTISACGVL